MELQEIYNTVKEHMLKQQYQSKLDKNNFNNSFLYTQDMCAYRGANGFKCAVGCLISDEAYNEALEGARYSIYTSDHCFTKI